MPTISINFEDAWINTGRFIRAVLVAPLVEDTCVPCISDIGSSTNMMRKTKSGYGYRLHLLHVLLASGPAVTCSALAGFKGRPALLLLRKSCL